MPGPLIRGEILPHASFPCRKVYARFGGGVCFFPVTVKAHSFDFYFRYRSLNEVGVLCAFIMLLLPNSLEKFFDELLNELQNCVILVIECFIGIIYQCI